MPCGRDTCKYSNPDPPFSPPNNLVFSISNPNPLLKQNHDCWKKKLSNIFSNAPFLVPEETFLCEKLLSYILVVREVFLLNYCQTF